MLKRILGGKKQVREGIGSNVVAWPDYSGNMAKRYSPREYQDLYLKSIADRTEILRKNPNDAETYRFRANDYYWIGEIDLALADYEKALSLSTDPGDIMYLRKSIAELKAECT
jgi:tetratricopeptide (TPR) repeat protein